MISLAVSSDELTDLMVVNMCYNKVWIFSKSGLANCFMDLVQAPGNRRKRIMLSLLVLFVDLTCKHFTVESQTIIVQNLFSAGFRNCFVK